MKYNFKITDVSYRGKETKEFEKVLEDYLGCYVACTNTGSNALFLTLKLLGLDYGSGIICPSITYVATANAIMHIDSLPIFADVKDDLNIDVKKLDEFLKLYINNGAYNIDAILPVHVLGQPCDMDGIIKLARKYKLKVVEDASQSLGSWYHGKHCGTIGDIGTLSFNGNKIITTGGGGAVLCKSKKMKEKAIHYSTQCKVLSKKQCYHDDIGYNFRMPAWNAKLGLINFNKCDKLKTLKDRSKHEDVVWNEWKKIDKIGEPVWTPIHTLPAYKNAPRMNCDNAERIGREVRIK